MPTYQYACTSCDHTFEQFQSFTDDALTVCPQCQGRLRKVYNAVGVVFKGSGFYRTDSRSDATATSDANKPSGGTDGSTSDSNGSGKSSSTDSAATGSSASSGSSGSENSKSASTTSSSSAA